MAFPACDAVTVHEPAPEMCTVAPVMVHFADAANDTARPEDALALTAKSALPNVLAARTPKVIVWFAFAIANVRATSAAALKLALPGCEAVTVHESVLVMCTVLPATVQPPDAANATARPDEAAALTAKSGSPNDLAGSGANVIV